MTGSEVTSSEFEETESSKQVTSMTEMSVHNTGSFGNKAGMPGAGGIN